MRQTLPLLMDLASPYVAHATVCSSCLQLTIPRDDLFLPTNLGWRITGLLPESATPMQSAAKVPILVAFQVTLPPPLQLQIC